MTTRFRVNGVQRETAAAPDKPLLWVLRDEFRLTGTKYGCGIAQCGACSVLLNGRPQRSCVTPAGSVADADVTTIEGMTGPEAEAVQAAWIELEVPQCGYCQSGQVMTATALLRATPNPTSDEILHAMDSNLCRCATYSRVRAAVRLAADRLEA